MCSELVRKSSVRESERGAQHSGVMVVSKTMPRLFTRKLLEIVKDFKSFEERWSATAPTIGRVDPRLKFGFALVRARNGSRQI